MGNRVRLVLDRPCNAEGRRFEPREGGRWCLHCGEMQHDLREATRSEALRVLAANDGRACVRLRLGPGGEPRFVPERPLRTAGPAALIAATLAACGSGESTPTEAPLASPPASAAAEAPPPPTPTSSTPPSPTPSEAPVAPADPPPPPTTEIDHSTDASPDAAHHRQHRHRHPPAQAPSGDQYDGGMVIGDF
jgi:hypothetical protein